jgi:hypothetical protein
MGIFHPGLPPWLVDWAAAQAIGVAVESGTYMGDSADRLARTFGRCITIERDATLAAGAARRFEHRPDVEVVHGSSRTELPVILGRIDGPVFFWLDAHWSAGVTAGADDPCPLIAELEAIASSTGPQRHVVAIDDMRLFGFGHDLDPRMEHFPSLRQVLDRLEAMGLATFVLDDVIVGVPRLLAESFLTLDGDIRQRVMLFQHWSALAASSPGADRARAALRAVAVRARSSYVALRGGAKP